MRKRRSTVASTWIENNQIDNEVPNPWIKVHQDYLAEKASKEAATETKINDYAIEADTATFSTKKESTEATQSSGFNGLGYLDVDSSADTASHKISNLEC